METYEQDAYKLLNERVRETLKKSVSAYDIRDMMERAPGAYELDHRNATKLKHQIEKASVKNPKIGLEMSEPLLEKYSYLARFEKAVKG